LNEELGGSIANIETYHHTLMIVKTGKGHVFGAYVTAMPAFGTK